MPHPIEQHLLAIGGRARRLLIGYALAWIVGAVVAAAILFGIADYLLAFDDPGLRILVSLSLAAIAAWGVVRFLVPAVRYRPSPVQVAQRVEQRYPEFSDRLASTVEFLREAEDDPTAGSAELRRSVIAQTETEVDGLNWLAVIDSKPAKRAAIVAGAIAMVAILMALCFPSHAAVAVMRLVNPLGSNSWPRDHYLAFREPVTRLAAGQPFEVELIDESGTLPGEVFIQYRYPDSDAAAVEQERMQASGDVMVARKEAVIRPFEYRAVGGDDDVMPWIAVEIVEPPRVESLSITLHPPAYTGCAPYQSPRGIEALLGTRVEMSGTVTKPLTSAVLKQENGPDVPAAISTDGRHFTIPAKPSQPMTIEMSGRYWFELTDRDGLTGGGDDRWDIRAIADPPPSVSLDHPAAGLFVTPTASLSIRAVVKDNLAIRRIALVYSDGDKSNEAGQSIELFAGPKDALPLEGATPISAAGETQTVEYNWDLAPLDLSPGTMLTVRISADDYQPKTGQSAARKITVITAAELEDRLAAQQAAILSELARVLKLEREIRSQTTGASEQIAQTAALRKADGDRLQAAELNQRQVRRALASPSDGVVVQIDHLIAELESNRLDSPELNRRLQQMSAAIAQLEREPLPEIERELTAALKEIKTLLAREPKAEVAPVDIGASTAEIQKSLAAAGVGQQQVIRALERLIDELTEWSRYRGLARDIEQIRQEQAALEQQTKKIGAETVAQDAQSLSPQQRADLSSASRSQRELAGRFGKLLLQMQRVAEQATDDAATSAETVADALHLAREQNLAGRMQSSAENIAGNRIGQASGHQAAVLRGLDDMLETLANRREQQLSRLVKKLREAENQLAELRQQQEGLQKKLERLTKEGQQPGANQEEIKRQLERLQREQRQLQEQTKRLTRQLERLQAERAAKSTASAANQMGNAEKNAAQGKPSEALDDIAKAKQDLDEAQKQLAERRRQAEQDLAHEQMAEIGDAIKSLADRQGRIVDEIFAYDAQRRASKGLTRAQSQLVLELSRIESTLADETTALAEKVAAAEVFHLALERAASEMKQAAELLAKLETGESTQRAASEALHRLQQVVEALAPDPSTNPPKPNQGGGGGGGNSAPTDKIATLAEVKLLKIMQEQVNLRTKELDQAIRAQPKLTADQRREYIELAKEQGKLAELLLKKAAIEPPPEDNPESL